MQEIRAVLSDWGKVVAIHDNKRAASALARLSERDGVTMQVVQSKIFLKHRSVFDSLMRGEIEEPHFCVFLRWMLGIPASVDDSEIAKAFGDVFEPNRPMMTELRRLRARGIRLVAVSNMDVIRHGHLKRLGVHDLFDAHALSYEMGTIKPVPRFYRKALEISGIPAEQTLFVDDHEENVAAATRTGMSGWRYDASAHEEFRSFLDTIGLGDASSQEP